MGSTYYKQKLVIAIVMSSVPLITIPMTIPVISPADSESSDATETVAVTETVWVGESYRVTLAIVSPILAYFEIAACMP